MQSGQTSQRDAVMILGRYTLCGEIAAGGMAAVYFARMEGTGGFAKSVAVKRLHPQFATDPDFRTMILDEARLAARIRHPNVVSPIDVIDMEDEVLLAMEYVHGQALSRLIRASVAKGETVPLAICASIMTGMLHGLHAAHEAKDDRGAPLGIVHRDISPHNVIVGADGITRVIDFGIAKAKERNTPETAEGVMKGKIPFMAPEHAMGGDVDRRSDLWSLGAVAYLMLSGKEPHEGPNDAARLIRKLSREPLAPLPPEVPEGFGKVVLKALSHSPDDRYPTASALAAAIREAVPPASCAEVADFFRRTLGETIRARQMMVERSIVAANARARARNMMSKPDFPSYSGEHVALAEVPATPDPSPAPQNHVSLPPPAEPNRPWAIYMTAAAIALAVVLAYALGATSTRSTASGQPSATTLPKASASPSLVGLSAAPSVAFTASSTAAATPSVPLQPSAAPSSAAPPPPSTQKPLVLPEAKPTPSATPSGPSGPSGPKPTPEETIF